MNRLCFAASLGLVVSLAAAARADGRPFGERAPNVLVLDHLLGVTRQSISEADSSNGFNITQVGGNVAFLEFSAPVMRFGYHRFVSEAVSLGAGLQWASGSAGGSYRVLGFHPRVGVAIPLSENSAFWLRAGGGVTHWDLSRDTTELDWSIGGEAFYVYTPVSHFGWTLGPMVDATVSATLKSRGGEEKLKRRTFGVTFGLLFDL